MSDEKKKKSADEIVEDVAAEMGINDAKVPESEASSENVMAGLGGIFDVPVKKKKKKEVVEEKPAAKKVEAEKSADKPKKKVEGVDIFTGGSNANVDSSYLGSADLGEYDVPKKSNTGMMIGVVVGTLVLAGIAVFSFGSVDDLGALFRGELRERRIAEKNRIEEDYLQKQLEAMELFGTLFISGNPKYATIKLNGKHQYGETSTGHFRDVQVNTGTVFQNLKVKEKQVVEVSAPGFQPLTLELTKGMWTAGSSGDYTYNLSANLVPLSPEAKAEFDMRLTADVDTDYFGAVTINTTPTGATVMFNNHPLLDEKGNELKTPVTFKSNYVRDDKGKLEERPVSVDTVIDQGHKIEIFVPNSDYPKYLTALQREMWTCDWKSESDLRAIGYNEDKDSIQKKCTYSWNFNFDFNALKQYIADRDAELKRIEEQNAAEKAKLEAAAKDQ